MLRQVNLIQRQNKKGYDMEGIDNVNTTIVTVNGKIEGKLIISKNIIGVLEKGQSVSDINLKFPREFYNVFTDDKQLIVAEDLADAESMLESDPTVEEEKEIQNLDDTQRILYRGKADGTEKKRLSKEDKEGYRKQFEMLQLNQEYRRAKTVKDQAIILAEKGFPISVIAYLLDKRFQQIRTYIVNYYGQNLKNL